MVTERKAVWSQRRGKRKRGLGNYFEKVLE
jgi:hypothetical protein